MTPRYEKFDVWQGARALVKAVYLHLRQYPREELYALTDQIKRAVVSVPSNIAEGSGRDSDRDFLHFLVIARGSLFEARTQLQLGEDLGFAPFTPDLRRQIDDTLYQLSSLIAVIRKGGV